MTSIGARGAIGAIGLYRRMPRLRPPVCRYEPTCSSYSVQAIERFGLVKGIFMSVRRVGRCNPWGGTGLDPVPPRKGVSTDV